MTEKQIIPIAEDLKVSDLRLVTLYWQNGGANSTHIVPAFEVERLKEATVRLHHTPGVNPANGGETRKVWLITSEPMMFEGPYWWSTPDLGQNDDPAGARLLRGNFDREILFEDREFSRNQIQLQCAAA